MLLTIEPQATANAGADATICEGSAYTLIATATHAASILWTSNGTGTFDNATLEDPTYTPSAADRLNGSVILTMTVSSASPCVNAVDQMTLFISRQAIVNAGPDSQICEGQSFVTSFANAVNTVGVLWTSSGTGSFVDPGLLEATYIPSNDDILNGSVVLTLTGISASPCPTDDDFMVLTINRQAIANAGPDDIICGGTPYSLSGASATNQYSVFWTTTGTGSFNSPYSINPTYTPSQNDIDDGAVTLIMTAFSVGACSTSVDEMVLSIQAPVEVFAGNDATICETGTFTLSEATSLNTIGLLWSTTGTGTFDNPAILNPVYTPSAADIASGSVVLTLTGEAPVPCDAVSDELVLTISRQVIVNAGADATICEGTAYILEDATSQFAQSLLWTSSGTGFFNNPSLINPTYTPSQADIINGLVVLTLTGNPASPCATDIDQMTLSISRQAVVNAGSDGYTCETAPFTITSGTATFYNSLQWTTSGTGTFVNPTILNAVYQPSAADVAAGFVTLTLTAQSNAPCAEAFDAMTLFISDQAIADAGVDITICEGSQAALSTAVATNATAILWTTSGTGLFSSATVQNPVYTPSASDILNGSVILTMTVSSAAPCAGHADQMTLIINKQAIINAGVDATICQGSDYTLTTSTAQNATSLLWTTSGTGTFDDATLLHPVYTPSAADITAGSVTLTLTAQSAAPCNSATDAMVLSISLEASANAGVDATICQGSTYSLSTAMATNAVSILWTTSGTGVFSNSTAQNPVYTPSQNDIDDGSVILTMNVTSAAPCSGDADQMVLTINKLAVVNAGPDATICAGFNYTLSAATASNAISILWTTSGSGTFDNATLLNPVYTPSQGDIAAGAVTLAITAQSNAPCGSASDAMVLTIHPEATANAGVDATICEGSSYTLSTAVATNATSILWTSSGTGSFSNATIQNPTYTPSNSDIINGSVVLTMTVTSAAPCAGDADQMVLTISRQAVVNAGPDASSCEGGSYTLAGATASYTTSVMWTSSGTGTFSDPTLVNPVYTPSAADIGNGSVVLTLTGQSAGLCAQVSDAMVLTINRQAIANAGSDGAICGGGTYALTGATALFQESVFWTTSGTGTFSSQYMVNPTYTPSQNDIDDGSVVLTMTAYSFGVCPSASDAMVLTISAPVEVNAGSDATICEGTTYTLIDASELNTTSLLWSTSGDGTFSDVNALHPVYTPGSSDIANGSATLMLTGFAAAPCATVTDQMVLTISHQASANAGADTTICEGGSYTLTGASAVNAVSIMWTSSGSGVFNNPTISNPTYTPSASDILNGSVDLTLHVQSALPCGNSSDVMTLIISRQATVNAGADITICESQTATLDGAYAQFATSWMWTTSGNGSFDNASALHPVYTPGSEDIANGSVVLTITAQSAGECAEVSDFLTLYISRQATVNAGNDDAVCAGSSYQISGATAANYASVVWTSSGTGYFDDATLLNAVYTPSVSDISNGSVMLTVVAQSAGVCNWASDQMLLTIEDLPTVSAGPDLAVCQGESLQLIGASASNYSSISWTTTGNGSILNGNTLSPTYVPDATETGDVTMTLHVSGSEACGGLEVTDEMVINIRQRVIADAGADQTIAYTSNTQLEGNAYAGSGFYVYNWQPASLLLNNSVPNPVTLPLMNHTEFVLLVSDAVTGCQDTDTVMVFLDGINYPPVAADDYDTTKFNHSVNIPILANDLDPENSALTVTFCSYPSNGLVVLNSNNTITYTPYEGFSGDDSLCYTICDKGVPVLCDQAMVYIHVLPEPDVNNLIIYNGLSPNKDGNNDTWKIKGIEDFPDNEVTIFNRWGDKIVHLNRYDNTTVFWDGSNANGNMVPDGTYYYILDIKGMRTFTGWIYVRSEN